MPPKSQLKKPRKPLTPLQRKQQKRKYDLIHKAQVKSQYYKELNKDTKDDTPDYVKEIFGAERTIDKEGNVVEIQREADSGEEDEYDLNQQESSSEEEEEDEISSKRQKRDEQMRQAKPNPFKSQLEERERLKSESLADKKERQNKFKQEKKARINYYKERNEQRGKMLARTKKGQPKMASQMDVLLQKIQKDMD